VSSFLRSHTIAAVPSIGEIEGRSGPVNAACGKQRRRFSMLRPAA
jgi:hypothetical protein